MQIRDPDTEAAVDALAISVQHLFITVGTLCDLLIDKGMLTKEEWQKRRAEMTEFMFAEQGIPVPPEFLEDPHAK